MVKRLLVVSLCAALGLGAVRDGRAEVLADSRFRPDAHGFSFANWGEGEHPHGDMTADDAAYLFGEQVCARFENESCVPTPGAKLWVEEMNKQAGGGHCEGLAALSAAFFINAESVQDYGGSKARDLPHTDPIVMRSITSLFATQFIEPVQSASRVTREYSLQQIIDTLVESLNAGGDYPTLGFYGEAGGHAVTPYKVERTGEGKYRIYIYDNNYPGVENHIDVDVPGDRWVYEGAALNPSEKAEPWSGGSGSMDITMTSVRYTELVCPFCDGSNDGGGKSGGDDRPGPDRAPASVPDELIVTTESPCREVNVTGKTSGRHMTVEDNGIPGASMTSMRGSGGCLLTLPDGEDYTILLGDGATLDGNSSGLAMFAPGKVFAMDDITLHNGQEQSFTVGDDSFTFEAGGDQTPTLRIGGQGEGADEYYEVRDFALGEGHFFSAAESNEGRFTFSNDDPELDDFDLYTEVVDDDGTESQTFDEMEVGDNGQFMLAIGDDGELDLDIDHDADGIADDEDTDDDGDGEPDSADTDDDGDGEPDATDEDDVEDEADDAAADDEDGSEDAGDASADDEDAGEDADDASGDEDVGDDEGDASAEDEGAGEDEGDASADDEEAGEDAGDGSDDEDVSEDEGDGSGDEDVSEDEGDASGDEDFGDEGESEDEGEDDFRP